MEPLHEYYKAQDRKNQEMMEAWWVATQIIIIIGGLIYIYYKVAELMSCVN